MSFIGTLILESSYNQARVVGSEEGGRPDVIFVRNGARFFTVELSNQDGWGR